MQSAEQRLPLAQQIQQLRVQQQALTTMMVPIQAHLEFELHEQRAALHALAGSDATRHAEAVLDRIASKPGRLRQGMRKREQVHERGGDIERRQHARIDGLRVRAIHFEPGEASRQQVDAELLAESARNGPWSYLTLDQQCRMLGYTQVRIDAAGVGTLVDFIATGHNAKTAFEEAVRIAKRRLSRWNADPERQSHLAISEAGHWLDATPAQVTALAERGVLIGDQVDGELRIDRGSLRRTLARRADMCRAKLALSGSRLAQAAHLANVDPERLVGLGDV